MKRRLIYTCSMCSHYDSNRSICVLNKQNRIAYSTNYAKKCVEEGQFVRYMHVLPDSYNYYSLDEEIPTNWDYDYSKIPKDSDGNPLVVQTKRGMEKALPANESVRLDKGNAIFGVPRILTYQGQREAIYELGVELARLEAEKQGVELTVLQEEGGSIGVMEDIREYYLDNPDMRHHHKEDRSFLSDKPIGGW
ncbi:hypothetical protein [Ammoniphilus resinae]|uniref:Uncharacterized protein n=1 Tax=Ammoniphilus resinae TaxID=861532 RepID=A0ABS4GNW2_9BACL|nr:hypothetical protein [Ammoniphilus resinae]MBP1931964.1 hypothetical protein [Ammoniphilus resinae]